MTKIHPTAVVEDGAKIAETAEIGPLCWISSQAKIGENVRLLGHVTVMGILQSVKEQWFFRGLF